MINTLQNIDNAIKEALNEGDRTRANYLSMTYFRIKYEGQDTTTDKKSRVNRALKECGLELKPTFKDEDGVQFYSVKVVE